ncbi:hypothetical protein HKX48_008571 [Thoreauomyces humboldtii]|nr:hypothetical protein HKX48_008571 [Thoreauomyces humboldtii]
MDVNMFSLLNSRPQRITYEKISGQDIVAPTSRTPVPFFVSHCRSTKVDLTPAKAAVVQIERCSEGTQVTVGAVVATVEIISCSDVTLVVRAPSEDSVAGTVTVDDSTDVSLDVPVGWTVYTTRCAKIKLHGESIIVDDSRLEQGLTPWRLRTSCSDGTWKTVRSNLYGDELEGEEEPETPVR